MQVENHSIDFVPEDERHGHIMNLFTVWFASNMQMTPLVTGALAVELGLNLAWSLVVIIAGNLIGAIFMAYHSAQGPKLGIPQMIQSRAQFGVIGAILPLIIVILMYVGFFASSDVLGAQAINGLANTHVSMNWSLIILSVITLIVTIIGYDLIHAVERWLSLVFAIVFIFVSIKAFSLPMPAGSWSFGHANWPMILLTLTIVVTWQIAYAPYVADYSRYMPKNTSVGKTFLFSYAGTVLSSGWMMILGVVLTLGIPKFLDNSSVNVANLLGKGGIAVLMYVIIALGIVAVNVLNLYGAFMSITTCTQAIFKFAVNRKSRTSFVTLMALVGTVLALAGQGNFLDNFTNFILFLAYFLIPWTAINLVDFYFVRHGEYSIPDIFKLDGIYGAYNWRTLIVYVVGVLVEIPFMNTTFYVGPLSNAMGGADISWIVGLVVSAPLYYLVTKPTVNRPRGEAVAKVT
ncbi:cytosine permease [Alicyclobacillus cycloheptanicus]|jgi:NCS1 family nucleobase:cation symporter-1|uniref:NCS1 family nucleobase:cation symporter-1 n=1 Tax=Alicyclobacillus cycloheptanicus TaxID=1457 RepID=A0ABT9XI01_9BACL|nr:cytosine permease [Alicyclobacillus cycloheptanicus]MDQ0189939.1 NCS1 family nucleobase:cation symporter-1 [Alicyclobacillus cycloheptanicus]WDM02163.1 cytosine permease [Alicyclobacillus cycloheptanicus]